eukprot:6274095-Pyramimonas_sp.AAC.2
MLLAQRKRRMRRLAHDGQGPWGRRCRRLRRNWLLAHDGQHSWNLNANVPSNSLWQLRHSQNYVQRPAETNLGCCHCCTA